MSEEDKNREIIRDVTEKMMAGHIEALFERFTPDTTLTLAVREGTPLSGVFRGPDQIRDYFVRLDQEVQMVSVSVSDYLVGGDKVAIFGHESYVIKRTGKVHETPFIQMFALADGRIRQMVNFQDMSGLLDAWR
jgi:ketosteroid isomerase-like protein